MSQVPSESETGNATRAGPACGICGGPSADIKSHIIPYCEQKRLKDGDEKFMLIDPKARLEVQEYANRFWQRWLLCQNCEAKCGRLDEFWADFSDKRGTFLANVKRHGYWVVPKVDVSRLTAFLISVLLRAHSSNRPEFAELDLGDAFPAAVKAFGTGDPFNAGFKLLVQIPQMDGSAQRFRTLPQLSPAGRGAVLWFGVFRFAVVFPAERWEAKFLKHTLHLQAGGLIVTTKPLEETPEYLAFTQNLMVKANNLTQNLRP